MKNKIEYKLIDIFRYWRSGTMMVRHKEVERWFVQNTTTWKVVKCTSESACKKIIVNAIAELEEREAPYKTLSLELKASNLID